MKRIVCAFVFLSGCAGLNRSTGFRDGDRLCGYVGTQGVGEVAVWKRSGFGTEPWVGCDEALAMVRRAVDRFPVSQPWDVYFTGGYAGWGVDSRMQPHAWRGMTYASERTIVVGPDEELVEHEMHHAQDVEQGRPSFHSL